MSQHPSSEIEWHMKRKMVPYVIDSSRFHYLSCLMFNNRIFLYSSVVRCQLNRLQSSVGCFVPKYYPLILQTQIGFKYYMNIILGLPFERYY